jgi:HEAT repeats
LDHDDNHRTVTHRRTVPIGLNCTQIALFGVLSYQLFQTYGHDHYVFEGEPELCDWVEFTAVHVLRAADLLHALDEYGIHLQNISHNSTAAGGILVCMHLVVDVFLIGLVLRWMARQWQPSRACSSLERGRRDVGWLLITVSLYVTFGALQQLDANDWLLWPLENLLRLLDIGSTFQIFHWKLHGVEAGFWPSTAAVIFRLGAGIWMTRVVILLRLGVFKTWGLSVEQLTALLADGHVQERRGAALGLGWTGPAAASATPALVVALRDFDLQVACNAAQALGQIGPLARDAVDALAALLWRQPRKLQLAATTALGRIGPNAITVLRDLLLLLRLYGQDRMMRKALVRAIRKIVPESVIANERAIHFYCQASDD